MYKKDLLVILGFFFGIFLIVRFLWMGFPEFSLIAKIGFFIAIILFQLYGLYLEPTIFRETKRTVYAFPFAFIIAVVVLMLIQVRVVYLANQIEEGHGYFEEDSFGQVLIVSVGFILISFAISYFHWNIKKRASKLAS